MSGEVNEEEHDHHWVPCRSSWYHTNIDKMVPCSMGELLRKLVRRRDDERFSWRRLSKQPPSRLVAFDSNEIVGTIILRESEGETLLEHQPELGGLYVAESHRGQGVGTELVQAGMKLARKQGYSEISATTVRAAGILNRLGWEFIKTVQYPDGEVSLYRCKLWML